MNIKSFTNSTNNTNNINNKPNNTNYTKQILSFLESDAGHWHTTSICQAAPGFPGLASSADRNWTQECMDRNLYQDRRQNNEQGPLQKLAIDEGSETFVIPQLSTEYDVHGMEYLVGQYWITCPVHPSLQVQPLPTPHL